MADIVFTTKGKEILGKLERTGYLFAVDTFKVGDSYGYIPDPNTVSDIDGALLHVGSLSSGEMALAQISDKEVSIVVLLKGNIGPFDVGEIGLYKGGQLIAIKVFDEPVEKKINSAQTPGSAIKLTVTYDFENAIAALDVSYPTDNDLNQITEVFSVSELPRAERRRGKLLLANNLDYADEGANDSGYFPFFVHSTGSSDTGDDVGEWVPGDHTLLLPQYSESGTQAQFLEYYTEDTGSTVVVSSEDTALYNGAGFDLASLMKTFDRAGGLVATFFTDTDPNKGYARKIIDVDIRNSINSVLPKEILLTLDVPVPTEVPAGSEEPVKVWIHNAWGCNKPDEVSLRRPDPVLTGPVVDILIYPGLATYPLDGTSATYNWTYSYPFSFPYDPDEIHIKRGDLYVDAIELDNVNAGGAPSTPGTSLVASLDSDDPIWDPLDYGVHEVVQSGYIEWDGGAESTEPVEKTYLIRKIDRPEATVVFPAFLLENDINRIHAVITFTGYDISIDFAWDYRVNGGAWTPLLDTTASIDFDTTGLSVGDDVEIRVTVSNRAGAKQFSNNAVVGFEMLIGQVVGGATPATPDQFPTAYPSANGFTYISDGLTFTNNVPAVFAKYAEGIPDPFQMGNGTALTPYSALATNFEEVTLTTPANAVQKLSENANNYVTNALAGTDRVQLTHPAHQHKNKGGVVRINVNNFGLVFDGFLQIAPYIVQRDANKWAPTARHTLFSITGGQVTYDDVSLETLTPLYAAGLYSQGGQDGFNNNPQDQICVIPLQVTNWFAVAWKLRDTSSQTVDRFGDIVVAVYEAQAVPGGLLSIVRQFDEVINTGLADPVFDFDVVVRDHPTNPDFSLVDFAVQTFNDGTNQYDLAHISYNIGVVASTVFTDVHRAVPISAYTGGPTTNDFFYSIDVWKEANQGGYVEKTYISFVEDVAIPQSNIVIYQAERNIYGDMPPTPVLLPTYTESSVTHINPFGVTISPSNTQGPFIQIVQGDGSLPLEDPFFFTYYLSATTDILYMSRTNLLTLPAPSVTSKALTLTGSGAVTNSVVYKFNGVYSDIVIPVQDSGASWQLGYVNLTWGVVANPVVNDVVFWSGTTTAATNGHVMLGSSKNDQITFGGDTVYAFCFNILSIPLAGNQESDFITMNVPDTLFYRATQTVDLGTYDLSPEIIDTVNVRVLNSLDDSTYTSDISLGNPGQEIFNFNIPVPHVFSHTAGSGTQYDLSVDIVHEEVTGLTVEYEIDFLNF